ncbi:MICOS complex subunit Mic60-like [Hyposmocoma kahamanoa]|uniref:MICOS complex subunit Mic60-like n=1 Tax=Hyposmocoma kahamanoa TaxID=1477025 RepID=UPI000E6D9D83|nr:MICOS complex subunit Mic60-like [Hyposmocoma kahamanoa]
MIRITRYVFTRSLLLQRNPVLYRILRSSQKPCTPPSPAVRVSVTHPDPERDNCKPPVPVRIKLSHEPERETCTPPPPPPPPPKDDKWIWLSLAAMIITGGFVVYAKNNAEVRDWLTIYAPWFDDLIAVAYRENMDYMQYAVCWFDTISSWLTETQPKPQECKLEGEVSPPPPAPPRPPPPEDPCKKGVKDDDNEEEVDEVAPCIRPPVKFTDICILENCMKDLAETAINNYMTARDACRFYNEFVNEVLNEKYCPKSAKILDSEMFNRNCLVKTSLEAAEKALLSLDDVSRYLECGCQLPKNEVQSSKQMLQEFKDKISVIRAEFIWDNDRALAEDEHWQKVLKYMDQYAEEISSIFPDVNDDARKTNTYGNIDIFLNHTHKYVENLQSNLKESLQDMGLRIDRAVNSLSSKDVQKCLQSEITKKKHELATEYTNRINGLKAKLDKETQDSLKALKEHQEKEAEKKAIAKEKEVTSKLDELVKKMVAEEKAKFDLQLKDMRSKLKDVEETLQARLFAEKETNRSQVLWAAGYALMEATRQGEPVVNVEKVLKAIEDNSGAKDGDKLVTTVLAAIPKSVYTKGVVPESVVKARYYMMEDVARKVALVENEGAPLPVYILSFLQDMLLFFRPSSIPQAELEGPAKNVPEDLDTFDLLQRANYYMQQGKIASAVAYVDKLEGASRGAAETWFRDALALLETRQAAAAIMAHATAIAAKYI